jgi:hypothetical protein
MPSDVVRDLARALDADDFARVAQSLAPDCEYRIGEELNCGPEEIVASYAHSSAWARENLDRIEYTSEVEPADGNEVGVRFEDHLVHGGQQHRFRCRQRFVVGDAGLVERIVHEEIPGEREALNEFFRANGLAPPS